MLPPTTQVSSSIKRSTAGTPGPLMPSARQVRPLTQVRSCDKGLTPIKLSVPMSVWLFSGIEHWKSKPEHQQSRYTPPALLVVTDLQLIMDPLASTASG
jgi:hypothetical protein